MCKPPDSFLTRLMPTLRRDLARLQRAPDQMLIGQNWVMTNHGPFTMVYMPLTTEVVMGLVGDSHKLVCEAFVRDAPTQILRIFSVDKSRSNRQPGADILGRGGTWLDFEVVWKSFLENLRKAGTDARGLRYYDGKGVPRTVRELHILDVKVRMDALGIASQSALGAIFGCVAMYFGASQADIVKAARVGQAAGNLATPYRPTSPHNPTHLSHNAIQRTTLRESSLGNRLLGPTASQAKRTRALDQRMAQFNLFPTGKTRDDVELNGIVHSLLQQGSTRVHVQTKLPTVDKQTTVNLLNWLERQAEIRDAVAP